MIRRALIVAALILASPVQGQEQTESDPTRTLTSTPEPEEVATFSPDGCFVAFVRNNDLWVVDLETATERALTTGGTDTLRNGKASWV